MSQHGSTLCSPTEEKILCRSPSRSGRRSLVCVRLSNKGKVGVQRGRKTAGCPSFLPTAAGAATLPPSADGESPPAEVQRKNLRPLGANTLTQFEYPAQPVQKRSRPLGANPPAAVRVPRSAGAAKRLPPRQGRTRLRQFVSPSLSVQKIYTKRAAAPMQQLFSMQNLNRTGSKPKFLRRYARSPR